MISAPNRELLVAYVVAIALAVGTLNCVAATRTSDPSQLQNSVGAGDITRSVASAISGVQLSAGNASNLASVKLASPLTHETSWSLTASTPISKDSSTSDNKLATLDGLANGFSLKLGFNKFHITNQKAGGDEDDALVKQAETLCENKGDMSKAACQALAPGKLVYQYPPTEGAYNKFLSDHFPNAAAWEYGAQLGVGFNKFSYYDSASLAPFNTDHVPYSGKLYVGYVPNVVSPQLITVGFEYQHAYTAASSKTACKVSSGPILPCITGAVGPPQVADKYLLSLDYHRQFDLGIPLAIAPQLTYDAKSKEAGVDFPIYFVSDSKGNLVAGFDIGWISKNHVFTIGFTVGAPFSIL